MTKSSEQCPVTVLQKVAVTGAVTIIPKIECGPLTVTCLDGKIIKEAHSSCGHKGQTSCRVLLVQELCVEVPVTFRVRAKCEVDRVHCGPATAIADGCEDDDSGSSGHHCDDDSGSSGCHSDDDSGSSGHHCDDDSGSSGRHCDDDSGSSGGCCDDDSSESSGRKADCSGSGSESHDDHSGSDDEECSGDESASDRSGDQSGKPRSTGRTPKKRSE